jgi:hypothetical protein
MILANRLTDGRVVFLAADGTWVASIAAGALTADVSTAQRLLAEARQAEEQSAVIDPYLIDIRTTAGARQPVSFREGIRAAGPTIRTDLAG